VLYRCVCRTCTVDFALTGQVPRLCRAGWQGLGPLHLFAALIVRGLWNASSRQGLARFGTTGAAVTSSRTALVEQCTQDSVATFAFITLVTLLALPVV
jgi:hypothetical protein